MEGVLEVVVAVDGSVLARLQYGAEDRLSFTAGVGAVAAPDFAVHDRRLQRLLRAMIRRRDAWVHQEHEPRSGMVVQMLGEPLVLQVQTRTLGQRTQSVHIILVQAATTIPVGAGGVDGIKAVAQPQRAGEQLDHLPREEGGRASVLVQKRARTPQRMVLALLMDRVLETVVGRETIVRHAARPIDADDFFQNISTALRVDGVEGCSIITDPAVKPDEVASDAPTRFIGVQMFGVFDVLLDLLVNGLENLASPQDDLGTGAA